MHTRHIAVYCASSDHIAPEFFRLAEAMGRELAVRGLGLVYGGGNVGLMGAMARAVHEDGGRVVGVIPRALRSIEGVAYELADEMVITDTMRERKKVMFDRSIAHVVLPGGIGTLEEFLEVITLKKLMYHDRPVGLVNFEGFFDGLLSFFDDLGNARFMGARPDSLFDVASTPADLFTLDSFATLHVEAESEQ